MAGQLTTDLRHFVRDLSLLHASARLLQIFTHAGQCTYIECVCVCVSMIYFPFEKSQYSTTSVTRNGQRRNNNRIVAEIIKNNNDLYNCRAFIFGSATRDRVKRVKRTETSAPIEYKRRLFHDVFSPLRSAAYRTE